MYPVYDMQMLSEAGAEVAEALAALLLSNSFSFLFSLAAYILTALSLYTIANRRGINHPWMAWIPVANLWILGSISDQYQYVTQGLIRNRRKTLLILRIIVMLLSVAALVLCAVTLVDMLTQVDMWEQVFNGVGEDAALAYVMESVVPVALGTCGIALVVCILALVECVFKFICYYNLFASCQPDNKVLYLLLSILFSISLPIFLMICRNKDLGMPPRKAPETPTYLPE